MRIQLHDFSGHPFQVDLSRELARRGHEVLHTYCADYVTGRGRLERTSADPATLRIQSLSADVPLSKYSPLGRVRYELDYAARWRELLDRERFDLIISCNVPLFALGRMQQYFRRRRQPWLFWHQDIYSLALSDEARRRLPAPVASLVSASVQRMERAQVAAARGVVAITDAMVEEYHRWGLRAEHATVVPNWAPLGEIVPAPRQNDWARRHGLDEQRLRLLYAGTLGRKHNPLLLLQILDAVRLRHPECELIVASEGAGADDLAAAAAGRTDVRLLGFQDAADLGPMLSSADVLLTLLEPDAARFSVPSKVLSYLSAGRPIVGLMPAENPAARQITDAGGFVASPDPDGARLAAQWVAGTADRPGELDRLGANARAIAEKHFDIGPIADRFEAVFTDAFSTL